ncbi:CPG_1a_G0006440.mRNA.1.CDS.1 [Saccharomyces cerevisiae]|nr:CPG_1a_G0006440.mRNA.1.CDS.1 [Saccharomyces cerevisiae]CAI7174737.1 CPG_1a_G0006440.mRNA.1.CDS.1 [Saccharomyces cerevisiae]
MRKRILRLFLTLSQVPRLLPDTPVHGCIHLAVPSEQGTFITLVGRPIQRILNTKRQLPLQLQVAVAVVATVQMKQLQKTGTPETASTNHPYSFR